MLLQPMGGHVLGDAVIPRFAKVLEVMGGGFQRRNAPAIFRGLPRQHRLAAVDAADGKATIWRRRPAASAPGCRSCGRTRRRRNRDPAAHGKFQAAGRLFAGTRQIEKRRQQRPRFDDALLNDLRDLQMLQNRIAAAPVST